MRSMCVRVYAENALSTHHIITPRKKGKKNWIGVRKIEWKKYMSTAVRSNSSGNSGGNGSRGRGLCVCVHVKVLCLFECICNTQTHTERCCQCECVHTKHAQEYFKRTQMGDAHILNSLSTTFIFFIYPLIDGCRCNNELHTLIPKRARCSSTRSHTRTRRATFIWPFVCPSINVFVQHVRMCMCVED